LLCSLNRIILKIIKMDSLLMEFKTPQNHLPSKQIRPTKFVKVNLAKIITLVDVFQPIVFGKNGPVFNLAINETPPKSVPTNPNMKIQSNQPTEPDISINDPIKIFAVAPEFPTFGSLFESPDFEETHRLLFGPKCDPTVSFTIPIDSHCDCHECLKCITGIRPCEICQTPININFTKCPSCIGKMKLQCYVCAQEFIGVINYWNITAARKCQKCFKTTQNLIRNNTQHMHLPIVPDVEMHIEYLGSDKTIRQFVVPVLENIIDANNDINIHSSNFKHYMILDGPNKTNTTVYFIRWTYIKHTIDITNTCKRILPTIEKQVVTKRNKH
jgi:hypothetical protein